MRLIAWHKLFMGKAEILERINRLGQNLFQRARSKEKTLPKKIPTKG